MLLLVMRMFLSRTWSYSSWTSVDAGNRHRPAYLRLLFCWLLVNTSCLSLDIQLYQAIRYPPAALGSHLRHLRLTLCLQIIPFLYCNFGQELIEDLCHAHLDLLHPQPGQLEASLVTPQVLSFMAMFSFRLNNFVFAVLFIISGS